MRKFTISGYFEAEDIEDAFGRLASHFECLSGGYDEEPVVLGVSEIRISPFLTDPDDG